MARGNEWEKTLLHWLDEQDLLLQVMCTSLSGIEIQDLIELDEGRDHFFVAGLIFSPPKEAFEERFRKNGREPVNFGIAKPDLLEIRKEEDGSITWRVIDAKSSMDVKVIDSSTFKALSSRLNLSVLYRPLTTFKYTFITSASSISCLRRNSSQWGPPLFGCRVRSMEGLPNRLLMD